MDKENFDLFSLPSELIFLILYKEARISYNNMDDPLNSSKSFVDVSSVHRRMSGFSIKRLIVNGYCKGNWRHVTDILKLWRPTAKEVEFREMPVNDVVEMVNYINCETDFQIDFNQDGEVLRALNTCEKRSKFAVALTDCFLSEEGQQLFHLTRNFARIYVEGGISDSFLPMDFYSFFTEMYHSTLEIQLKHLTFNLYIRRGINDSFPYVDSTSAFPPSEVLWESDFNTSSIQSTCVPHCIRKFEFQSNYAILVEYIIDHRVFKDVTIYIYIVQKNDEAVNEVLRRYLEKEKNIIGEADSEEEEQPAITHNV